MLQTAIPPQWKRQWDELMVHLHDPFKLRVSMLSVVAAIGFLGVYRPMSSNITILRRDLKSAEERLGLVHDIEKLRATRVKLLENLPEHGDVNFWSEYFLSGIRESDVNLRTLDSNYRKAKIGKLQGAYFDLEITGTYEQVQTLLAWVERSRYFARVVKLRLKSEPGRVEGKLTVAVLVAQDKAKAPVGGASTSAKAGASGGKAQGNSPPQPASEPGAKKGDGDKPPQAEVAGERANGA